MKIYFYVMATATLAALGFGQNLLFNSDGNSDLQRVLIPAGIWDVCESGLQTLMPKVDCSHFKPGHEQYTLQIIAKAPETTIGYIYEVHGTRSDGQVILASGIARRNATEAGYETITEVTIDFGCPVKSWRIGVRELKSQDGY